MAQPIYKVFMVRPTAAWHQLSQDERDRLMAKVSGALEQVGGKFVVLCDSSWSSEEWPFFGVEEYPDLEAVQAHARLLNELNWFRYIESTTALGTAQEQRTQ